MIKLFKQEPVVCENDCLKIDSEKIRINKKSTHSKVSQTKEDTSDVKRTEN